MAMVPFYTRFPDLAWKEMWSVSVRGLPPLPDGDYGFLELYCDERDCDCRRVIIQILSSSTGSSVWATINYGWETLAFYEHWLGDKLLAQECQGPELDPLNAQSQYSAVLLELFKSVLQDTAYVERLQRHYALFKASSPAQHTPVGMRKQRRKRKRR
jgi:hypothetical protein